MLSRHWMIAAAVALVACGSPDVTSVSPPGVLLAKGGQDLDGKPDLVVDAQKLATSWVVYHEIVPDVCSAREGDVEPGPHTLLRFTVTTPNIGDADVFIGDPNKHYDPDGDPGTDDGDGLFEESLCHAHYHFKNYATYELFETLNGEPIGNPILSAKRGFCMIDVTPYSAPGPWEYRNCGRPAIPSLGLSAVAGYQGISVGWADTYVKWLAGQYFVVDGLAGGRAYLLRVTVNPPFPPEEAGEVCFMDDDDMCHNFAESDYTNNVGEVLITLPSIRPGKMGFGPGGNQLVPANAWTRIEG